MEASLTTFPSNQFAKAERERGDFTLVAKVSLPGDNRAGGGSDGKPIPLVVGPAQLREIHQKVLMMS